MLQHYQLVHVRLISGQQSLPFAFGIHHDHLHIVKQIRIHFKEH